MERYNQAIQLIETSEYLKAEKLLKSLFNESKYVDEVNWALGLIQIYLGYPHRALQYWRYIKNSEKYNLEEKIKTIEHSIPYYQSLYDRYNQALGFIKNQNYSEAYDIFHSLLQEKDALPLEIYEGYLYLSLYLEKSQELEEFLNNVPPHVKSSPSFIRGSLLDETQKELSTSQQKLITDLEVQSESNNKKLRKYKAINKGLVATVAVVTLSFILLSSISNNKTENALENTNQSDSEPIQESIDEQVQQLEQLIETKEEQINNMQAELEKSRNQLKEIDDKITLLEQDGNTIDQLVKQSELNEYRKGYTYYQNGQYELALTAFTNSRKVNNDSYFADDALYFAIQSKRKLGQDVLADYDEFLSYSTDNFIQSPYIDDVIFQKAKLKLTLEETEDAIVLLEQLASEYSTEWTGIEAKSLLNRMAK